MTSSYARIALAVGVAAVWASCSVPLYVDLFNNSDELVIVDVHDRTTKIQPGESQEFQLGMSGGPYALFTSGSRYQYELDLGGLRALPYHRYGSGWQNRIKLQLEPDFRVFIVERGEKPPLSIAGLDQPEGFPIVPSRGPWPAGQQRTAAERLRRGRYTRRRESR